MPTDSGQKTGELEVPVIEEKIEPVDAVEVLSAAEKKRQRQQSAYARKQLAPLRKKSNQLENKVEKYQAQLVEIESSLAEADLYLDTNKQKLKQQLGLQAEIKKSISENEEQWFDIQQQIEQFDS